VIFLAAAVMTIGDCKGIETCVREVRKLIASERSMNLEFQAALQRLRTCKPANSTKCYDMTRAIRLVQAEQTTWLTWRNAHCDVFAFSMENTSAEGELRAYCRIEQTQKRTAELQKIGRA
jgi:uncharacterized protein YecT (DUF1311 family)